MNLRKITFLVFNILFISSTVVGQNIKKVDEMISKRQFLSAWNYMDSLDKKNEQPKVVIKKAQFALRYYSKTQRHKKFAFKNLGPKERFFEHRQKAEKEMLPMVDFYIPSVLDSLKKKHPKNFDIDIALGDFYFDVYSRYKGYWEKTNQELMRLYFNHYKNADDNGVRTNVSLSSLGTFYSMIGDYDASLKYFERSVQMDSTYAPALYNLANLYTELDSTKRAIKLAVEAYNNYQEKTYKADAARMAGILMYEDSAYISAVQMLLVSDQLAPTNYYTYNYLLKSFLAQGKTKQANVMALNMFNLDWKNHTIYNAIIEAYLKYNKSVELIKFFEERLAAEQYDMEYRGFVHFHLSQVYYQQTKKAPAEKHIKEARKSFTIALDKANPLFAALDKMDALIAKMP